MSWNYRTVEYRYLDEEVDLYVHEIFYDDDNNPIGFTEDAIPSSSKEEAALILAAYELPPVAYMDCKRLDEQPEDWGWLNQSN